MTATERTQIIITKLKGQQYEYTSLHTILCITYGWDNEDCIEFREWIDQHMIAARLDTLRNAFQE